MISLLFPEDSLISSLLSSMGVEKDIYDLIERLFYCIGSSLNREVKIPFKRLTYREAMEQYGTDKPDLRFECKIINLTEILSHSEFKIFKECIDKDGIIIAIKANNCGVYSRKQLAELEDYVKSLSGPGLIWLKIENNELRSPIAKYINNALKNELIKKTQLNEKDLLLIMSGEKDKTYEIMGQLRLYIAKKENWIDPNQLSFVWITNFPLFEYSEEEKRWVSKHHPFTSPDINDLNLLESEPWKAIARAYDIVLNGYEIGGGSIRIHNPSLQNKIFSILGLTNKEIEEKFGFFIEALQYGAPPHGGIALGLDRIIMIFANEDSIRDVIPFPKTTKGQCLLTQSPSEISKEQLKELGIFLIKDENN